MNVQSPSSYIPVGGDVLENYIESYAYEYDYSKRKAKRTYTDVEYMSGDRWPNPEHEGDPDYEWENSDYYNGGKFIYKTDKVTGDLIIKCDGNHTKPFTYAFIDSYVTNNDYTFRPLQDAHYHLSGCPAGGSRNTYFLYLGPYSRRRGSYDVGNNIYTDMGFDTYGIDTGNGVDIDLRDARYYRNCSIGNKLIDGTDISSMNYCVTETGLHLNSGYVTPYGPVLAFVIMPGVALNNLRVSRPKLIKTAEAYYKNDDVFNRPLSMSPIDGYSIYNQLGLELMYDWNRDGWSIKGTLNKESSDVFYFNYYQTMPLMLGHKYAFASPKMVKGDYPYSWNFYVNSPIEEMDEYYKNQYNPLGSNSWSIYYSNTDIVHANEVQYTNVYVEKQEYSWGEYYNTNVYKPIQDKYEFTIPKEKYEGVYYDEVAVRSCAINIYFNNIPNGTDIDIFISAPTLASLSGPDKNPQPEPDPPPQRPEPAKPAEPDIVWNLGTSFVISPDSYETGLLDNYESLIWNEVYNDVGDFEVYTCVDDDILKICKPGNMITRADSDKIMIIESVKITTDVESGNHITVKGRSYESVLDRRIIWDQTTVSGSVHDAIKKLITDAIIDPKNECRKIDNFIFEDSTEEAVLQYQMDEAQFEGESLLESIKKICDIFHLGFKIYMNEEGQFAFKLYSGTDRSYYQEDLPYVIFSHNFGNLLDSEFITDSYNYKTTMLVMSDVEDDTIKTKRVTIGDGYSGMNRREVSYKSSTSPNKESGAGKYTNEEFARMLNEDGTRQLTEYKVVNQFQGSADIHQMYIYGEDFFLGDIVQIVDEFGNSACSRVNRLVISHDSNGIYSYPEFEVFERGNKVKISTGSMDADNPSINVKYNDSLTTEHFASEYSTEYTSLYGLVGVAYELVQEKSFTIKSLKRVMFRGKIYDENTVLATFPFNVFTDLEINEYIDEEETYS